MPVEMQHILAQPAGGIREGSLEKIRLNRWNAGEVYLRKAYFSIQGF